MLRTCETVNFAKEILGKCYGGLLLHTTIIPLLREAWPNRKGVEFASGSRLATIAAEGGSLSGRRTVRGVWGCLPQGHSLRRARLFRRRCATPPHPRFSARHNSGGLPLHRSDSAPATAIFRDPRRLPLGRRAMDSPQRNGGSWSAIAVATGAGGESKGEG